MQLSHTQLPARLGAKPTPKLNSRLAGRTPSSVPRHNSSPFLSSSSSQQQRVSSNPLLPVRLVDASPVQEQQEKPSTVTQASSEPAAPTPTEPPFKWGADMKSEWAALLARAQMVMGERNTHASN